MSIIYRALQKTQKNREKGQSPKQSFNPRTGRPDRIMTGLMIVIGLLTVIVVLAYYPIVKNNVVAMFQPKPPVIQMVNEEAFKAKHMLNGIFISDNNQFAMINNQNFRVGDMIDGFLIFHICDKDVRMRNEHQTITIEAPV